MTIEKKLFLDFLFLRLRGKAKPGCHPARGFRVHAATRAVLRILVMHPLPLPLLPRARHLPLRLFPCPRLPLALLLTTAPSCRSSCQLPCLRSSNACTLEPTGRRPCRLIPSNSHSLGCASFPPPSLPLLPPPQQGLQL